MKLGNLNDEEILVAIIGVITAFIWINVSPSVGAFYTVAVMFYLVPVMSKRRDWIVQTLTNRPPILNGVIIAFAVLFVWIIASSFILDAAVPSTEITYNNFFEQLRLYTNIPVLSSDPIASFATYGIAIPIIESFIFLSFALSLFLKVFKMKLGWYPPGHPLFYKMLWIVALVGVTGSMFHLTIRQLADVALIVDGLFFAVSAFLVFRFKRLFEGMVFHILTNSGVLILGASAVAGAAV